MPVLVKVKDARYPDRIICVYAYDSMKTVVKHSHGLVSYYDVGKKAGKYNTYKTFLEVERINVGEFRLLKAINKYT